MYTQTGSKNTVISEFVQYLDRFISVERTNLLLLVAIVPLREDPFFEINRCACQKHIFSVKLMKISVPEVKIYSDYRPYLIHFMLKLLI